MHPHQPGRTRARAIHSGSGTQQRANRIAYRGSQQLECRGRRAARATGTLIILLANIHNRPKYMKNITFHLVYLRGRIAS